MGEIAMIESPGKEVEGVLYGDLMRREEHYVGKRAKEMKVLGKIKEDVDLREDGWREDGLIK